MFTPRSSRRTRASQRYLATTLCLSLLPLAVAPISASAQTMGGSCDLPDDELVRATEAEALALAAECETPVEIGDWRTIGARSLAMPDGFVRTETYAMPKWTVDGEGDWVDIDPTLEVRSDGTIATAATVSEISVSAGGESPLVSVTDPEGGMFGLVWPEPLPEPSLDGGSATYASVLPDVDLRVDVGNEQIGYVLIVHTPEAAQSPELDRIEFEVVTDGLDVVQDEQTGLLHAVDMEGEQVYSSEPALMWDSSRAEFEAEQPAADSTAIEPLEGFGLDTTTAPLPEQPAEATADASGAQATMPGRIEQMEVDLDGETLSVVPDEAMLGDPDTEYPVYIDPTFTGSMRQYAKLHQQRPNSSSLWRNGALAVGLQLWQSGSTYGLWRSAVRFDISSIRNRYIQSAKVQVTQTHLAGCSSQWLRIWRVRNITSSGTTWNNVSPLEGGYLQSKEVRTSNTDTCGGTNQTVTYDNSNVKATVRKAVNNGNSAISFMFQSANENPNNNGSHAWRTLSASSAKIIVDHRPKKSTGLKTDGSNCSTSGPGPWVSSTRPKLTAKAPRFTDGSGYLQFHLYTASSGSNFYNWYVAANSGETVTATVPSGKLSQGNTYRWRVMAKDSKSSSGAWQGMSRCWFRVNSTPSAPTGPSVDGLGCSTEWESPTLVTTRTPNLTAVPRDPDGGNVRLRLQLFNASAENLQDWYVDAKAGTRTGGRVKSGVVSSDGLYGWRAYTYDGFGHGAASSYCWIRIDTTAPEPPDVAQVTANPAPGQQVTFDLIGSSEVTEFRYAVQGGATQTVSASGGQAQATVTAPSASNDHVLQVWARDAAGNESSRSDFWFTTGAVDPLDPETVWRFDGDGLDDSGNGNDVVASGLTYTTGHNGRTDAAVAVTDEVTSCAYSSGPHLDTTDSFTVAAWVRKGGDAEAQMIINQGGEVIGGFVFMYAASWDRWLFSLPDADVSSPNWSTVASDEPPAEGQWQHLAGVYDAPAERIRLYVDGELQDSEQVPFPAIASEGRLSAGCKVTTANYAYQKAVGTDIDEVAVFQQVLTGDQIVDLKEGVNLPAATQAWYPLRGDGAEHTGRGEGLGGVTETTEWTADHLGRTDSALHLDGTTCLTVSAPVDTAGTFSVSAWARTEPGAANNHTRVLAFSSDTYFTAALKHDASTSSWGAMVAKGATSESGIDGIGSGGSAAPGEWTHLVMVVNRTGSDHVLSFYVDGEMVGRKTLTGEALSAGEFSIGCERGGGNFIGDIADVRVWRGAVTSEEVGAIPTDMLAYWELDETLQGDDTHGGHDLTLNGAYDWVENRFNDCFASYGLGLDGTGYGSTASPVVTTDESFTVTAWVKLADLDSRHTVVAQGGDFNSGFTLGYNSEQDRFEFAMPSSDTVGAEWSRALAQVPPEQNEDDGTSIWYHLAGQVDLGAGVIRLYVDGELQSEAPVVDSPWQATGPLTMGAGQQDGQIGGHMVGMIDEVHVYSGVLDQDAIGRLSANRPWQPVNPDGSCDGDDEPPGEW